MAAPKPPPLRIEDEQEAALIKKYGMKPKLSPRLLAKVGFSCRNVVSENFYRPPMLATARYLGMFLW